MKVSVHSIHGKMSNLKKNDYLYNLEKLVSEFFFIIDNNLRLPIFVSDEIFFKHLSL